MRSTVTYTFLYFELEDEVILFASGLHTFHLVQYYFPSTVTHLQPRTTVSETVHDLRLTFLLLLRKGHVCGLPMKNAKVQELSLEHNRIAPDGAKVIAALCSATASVTSVSLLGNQFDDATVEMLLKFKEEKPTLMTLCGLKPDQTLCGLKPDQTKADFKDSGLTAQDAKLLAPEILVHAALTSVSLLANRFDDETVAIEI